MTSDEAFTPQGQAAIREWIFGILDDLPTTGPVGFGMDTNGNSIEPAEYHGDAESVAIGTFDEGWVTQPAQSSECPGCEGEQPVLVIANMDEETLVHDCLACRTRAVLTDGGGLP